MNIFEQYQEKLKKDWREAYVFSNDARNIKAAKQHLIDLINADDIHTVAFYTKLYDTIKGIKEEGQP